MLCCTLSSCIELCSVDSLLHLAAVLVEYCDEPELVDNEGLQISSRKRILRLARKALIAHRITKGLFYLVLDIQKIYHPWLEGH